MCKRDKNKIRVTNRHVNYKDATYAVLTPNV